MLLESDVFENIRNGYTKYRKTLSPVFAKFTGVGVLNVAQPGTWHMNPTEGENVRESQDQVGLERCADLMYSDSYPALSSAVT